LDLLESVDAFRRPDRFEQLLLACEADARGRTGLEDRDYPQPARLRAALKAAKAINIDELRQNGLDGTELGAAIKQARVRAINDLNKDRD
ncbi:MAG: multifunctional CCA tRNA nucleotidyl transferase/2'3'-cyclic phosphodiesterase/2'nucleotidase/phosphatase, partial [Gammaproteobacteria bacterium]